MCLNVTLYVCCLPCFIYFYFFYYYFFFLDIGLSVTCPCKTVNSAFYNKVLKHLSNAIQHSRPEKWGNNWILHHENTPCHTSLTVQQFLVKNQIPATPNHQILQIALRTKSGSSRGSGLGIHKKN